VNWTSAGGAGRNGFRSFPKKPFWDAAI